MAKPSDEQTEFLAKRSLELMGGREAAIASMEKEYSAMKERWKQDVDTIGRILRAHLHVEYYLTEEYIELNHLLKLAGFASSGGGGSALVVQGLVTVDGKPESRKRNKIRAGQVVRYQGARIFVLAPKGS